MANWTQVSQLGTDFVHPRKRTQKLTEGTDFISNYFRRNQMAQVTYRGVKYDTNRNKAQQAKEVELTYRGIAHTAK